MNVAFFLWPATFASGHDSLHATLLDGLLSQERHRITVVIDEAFPTPAVAVPHRTVTYRRGRRGWWPLARFDRANERPATAIVRALGVDALIACANFPMPRVPEIPLLATLHETDFLDQVPWHWFPARLVPQMGAETLHAVKAAAGIFANSQYTADKVCADHGARRETTFVSAPAVRPFASGPIRVPEFAPYVAQVGWFMPRKGVLLGLRGWVQARRQGLDRGLVLIGREGPLNHVDGSLARQVIEEAGEFAHDVHIVGHVSSAEYAALLAGADALLVPSHQEGFGIPVIEAFSLGTPVVAVRRTALVEVAGPAGVLVEPDPEALAAGLFRAIAEPVDVDALHAYAAQFTPTNQAAPVLAFLDRLETESRLPCTRARVATRD